MERWLHPGAESGASVRLLPETEAHVSGDCGIPPPAAIKPRIVRSARRRESCRTLFGRSVFKSLGFHISESALSNTVTNQKLVVVFLQSAFPHQSQVVAIHAVANPKRDRPKHPPQTEEDRIDGNDVEG